MCCDIVSLNGDLTWYCIEVWYKPWWIASLLSIFSWSYKYVKQTLDIRYGVLFFSPLFVSLPQWVQLLNAVVHGLLIRRIIEVTMCVSLALKLSLKHLYFPIILDDICWWQLLLSWNVEGYVVVWLGTLWSNASVWCKALH